MVRSPTIKVHAAQAIGRFAQSHLAIGAFSAGSLAKLIEKDGCYGYFFVLGDPFAPTDLKFDLIVQFIRSKHFSLVHLCVIKKSP